MPGAETAHDVGFAPNDLELRGDADELQGGKQPSSGLQQHDPGVRLGANHSRDIQQRTESTAVGVFDASHVDDDARVSLVRDAGYDIVNTRKRLSVHERAHYAQRGRRAEPSSRQPK